MRFPSSVFRRMTCMREAALPGDDINTLSTWFHTLSTDPLNT